MTDEERLLLLLSYKKKALRSQSNLIDFCEFVSPSPDHPNDVSKSLYLPQKYHIALAQALEKVEMGLISRLIISLPPRHGKSELASKMFPSWFMGRNPHKHMILATYNEKFSWDFGRKVRGVMKAPEFAQVFPQTALKYGATAVDRLEVDGGGALFFTGRGGTVTGRGGDLILIDDPIKDRKEADSPAIREHLWDWYNQVIKTRLMTKAGAVVLIQTRWHEDDLIGRLTDPSNPSYNAAEAKKWHIIDLPALALEDDILGRKPGEALWPERFDEVYLESARVADARGFQALYQGRPTPEDGAFFHAQDLRTYDKTSDLPDNLRIYIASDHAVSTEQNRDKTCLLPVGVDEDDNIWVLPDVYWKQAPSDQVVEAMLHMMQQHKPVFWWAEKGHISKSIGPFLRKRMREERVYASIIEVTPTVNKQARAQSIHARMSMQKVYFPSFAKWWPDARNELLKFPQGLHDDFVDALAYIGLGLGLQRPTPKQVMEAKKENRLTYGWLKKQSDLDRRRRQAASDTAGW
jgi:predicted phage terminase large subunit-like protein